MTVKLVSRPLPVEIVLHPAWWNAHAGIIFDEDFFYHPLKRVESERQMERVLYEHFGRWGLGADRDKNLPIVGAVHNAAGYLLSEMLGCEVRYSADAPPEVVPALQERLTVDEESPFRSKAYKRFENLCDQLKERYGYLCGDVNWSGVLNLALDLRGQDLLLDMRTSGPEVAEGFARIAGVMEEFVNRVHSETGSSSISVNRTVRHLKEAVFLHSECSVTMISEEDYEIFLMSIDAAWSQRHRPFGIHYCGRDSHRFAQLFGQLPHLDFLDVGWGGDIHELRKHLPETFFNIRLDPATVARQRPEEIRQSIERLVEDSANPWLSGVCCINMDQTVSDEQISVIFETVEDIRKRISEKAGATA